MKALGDHDNLYLLGEGALPIAHIPLTLNAHVGHSSGKSGLAASFWGASRGRCCSAPTPSFRPVKATKAPKALLSVQFFRLTF